MTVPRGASPFEPGDVTMRTCLGVAILLAFAPSAVGADDPKSLLKEGIAISKEAVTVLKSVTDKASAEAALPKLKALGERFEAYRKKLDALGTLPGEQTNRLKPQYEELIETGIALQIEVGRVKKLPAAAAVLKDVFPLKQTDEEKAIRAELEKVKITAARIGAVALTQALEVYKVKHGEYPATLEALAQNQPDGGPALVPADRLIDPWGRAYLYNPAGPKNKGLKPDVWSTGPDSKKPDGVIGNWQDKK
jgi:hypothetical protein